MDDVVSICDLEVWSYIGYSEEERKRSQRLLVTVELVLNTQPAAIADDLSLSVDYTKVANDIVDLAITERKTIECFAEDVARDIISKYSPYKVRITVKKFPLPNTKAVCVSITRSR